MSVAAADPLDMLAEDLARFYDDPLGFVLWAFPWGEAELAVAPNNAPREWQRKYLDDLGEHVRERGFDGAAPVDPIQMATVSGHGIGKSALSAWIILWIMATRPRAKGTVTANTADQLRTKTWAELGKWLKRSLVAEMFNWTGGRGSLSLSSVEEPESWRCDGITCREENSEAFAGQHAADSTPFYLFDEASAVPDAIYEVASGGLTDGEPMWFLFGNPTRNTGRFKEAANGRLRHRWDSRSIDSRKVEGTNKALFEQWVTDYGEDSDFVRVRVAGKFPRASSTQFIPSDIVQAARKRDPGYIASDPVVFGVDVARFGDDASALAIRRGRDARTFPWRTWRKLDTMQIAAHIFQEAQLYQPDAIFVDVSGGLGAGVADRLRQMNQRGVIDVEFGSGGGQVLLDNGTSLKAWNMAAAMWMKMRDWLPLGCIPDSDDLEADLVGREYGFRGSEDAIQLESKDDMKKRGLASPDLADALGLTFAYPVAPRAVRGYAGPEIGVQATYDIHADLR